MADVTTPRRRDVRAAAAPGRRARREAEVEAQQLEAQRETEMEAQRREVSLQAQQIQVQQMQAQRDAELEAQRDAELEAQYREAHRLQEVASTAVRTPRVEPEPEPATRRAPAAVQAPAPLTTPLVVARRSAASPVSSPVGTPPLGTPAAPPDPPATPVVHPARGSGGLRPPRPQRSGASDRPTLPRRALERPALPWHLRRAFLLPIVVLCLLGSLSYPALVALRLAGGDRTGGALSRIELAATAADGVPDGATPLAAGGSASAAPSAAVARTPVRAAPPTVRARPSTRGVGASSSAGGTATGAASTPAASAPTARRRTSPPSPAATSPAAVAAAAPAATTTPPASASRTPTGDVTYEGFGTSTSTSVRYTVDGRSEVSDTGGAEFSLPLVGSGAWGSWYVAVQAEDHGSAGCRILDADGTVLVQSTASAPGQAAVCSLVRPR